MTTISSTARGMQFPTHTVTPTLSTDTLRGGVIDPAGDAEQQGRESVGIPPPPTHKFTGTVSLDRSIL